MGNKFYRRGREKEYRIIKRLRAEGYDIAQRTAGSHSPIDVIAIDKKNKVIKLIQSKPFNYSETSTNKLYNENIELNGVFEVIYSVE